MVFLYIVLMIAFNASLFGSYLDKKTLYKHNFTFEPMYMICFMLLFTIPLLFYQNWLKKKRKTSYFISKYRTLCENEKLYQGLLIEKIFSEKINKEKIIIERYLKIIKIKNKKTWI